MIFPPLTYGDLIDFNTNNALLLDFIGKQKLVDILAEVAPGLIERSDPRLVLEIYFSGDKDSLVQEMTPSLLKPFQDEVGPSIPSWNFLDASRQTLAAWCFFEYLTQALDFSPHGSGRLHPHSLLPFSQRLVYGLSMTMYAAVDVVEEQDKKDAIQGLLAAQGEREGRAVNVDDGKENDIRLAPAEKARVLRNAIRALNAVGITSFEPNDPAASIIKNHTIERYADYRYFDLAASERFFEQNRDKCPQDIIQILHLRMSYAPEPPFEGEFDPFFYTRRSNSLPFLFKFFDKVISELARDALI